MNLAKLDSRYRAMVAALRLLDLLYLICFLIPKLFRVEAIQKKVHHVSTYSSGS